MFDIYLSKLLIGICSLGITMVGLTASALSFAATDDNALTVLNLSYKNTLASGTTQSNTVAVTAYDYAFVSPSVVQSGWARIVLDNQRANEIHEVTIVRLPDGIDYQTYLDDFIEPWMEIWHDMKNEEVTMSNLAKVANDKLPDWSSDLDYRHARGIISPQKEAAAYAYLPEGTYAVECWLKTEDGHVHIAHGMIREMTVTGERSTLKPPKHGVELSISEAGIKMPASITTGQHTFIAEVAENENGKPVFPDLHLIRLDEDTQPGVVVEWLDWYQIEGLTSPAPATFLGGYSTYGAALIDNRAYFELNINVPGDYAWVIQSDPDNPIWYAFSVSE